MWFLIFSTLISMPRRIMVVIFFGTAVFCVCVGDQWNEDAHFRTTSISYYLICYTLKISTPTPKLIPFLQPP